LWLIKHLLPASTFVVKITTLAKPETVMARFKDDKQSTKFKLNG
jgi:hypothetical protein